jgi:hypothetical protein
MDTDHLVRNNQQLDIKILIKKEKQEEIKKGGVQRNAL